MERIGKQTGRVPVHGHRRGKVVSPEYQSWKSMKSRCFDNKHKNWDCYGGRGISICPEWHDFSVFLKDMGSRPTLKHSLGRLNNDDNYSPSNCAWQTPAEQKRAVSYNRIVSFDGKSMILKDAADECGVDYSTLHSRLSSGWDVERALTTPTRKYQKVVRT